MTPATEGAAMESNNPMKHLNVKPVEFWNDFKEFAFKGNLIDLAVAVVIGNAFGAVVTSLVKNILMPMISYLMPNSGTYRDWHVGKIEVGAFLGEVLNFTIIALAMFVIVVKLLGSMQKIIPSQTPESTTKECPFCASEIAKKAVKCPHCTADLVENGAGHAGSTSISAKST